jgi:hypothetical protein
MNLFSSFFAFILVSLLTCAINYWVATAWCRPNFPSRFILFKSLFLPLFFSFLFWLIWAVWLLPKLTNLSGDGLVFFWIFGFALIFIISSVSYSREIEKYMNIIPQY